MIVVCDLQTVGISNLYTIDLLHDMVHASFW